MTDMRRTLLWVVFTMSLVLLWDAWNKHNGQPSMFGSSAPKVAAAGSAPGAIPVPPAALPASGVAAPTAPVPSAPAQAAVASEKVTISTDVVKATLDTLGGSLVRVELLKHDDVSDPSGHVVILDTNAQHVYKAETGLTGVAGAPTHLSLMTLVPGDHELRTGADTLSVRFESAVMAGLKLVKTYTFKRGDYAIDVKHEVVNESSASLSPQLYVQLVRDSSAGPGQSSFYSTFTGPAVYTDKSKFHKITFADIDKGKAEFDPRANDGWVAMVQHYFVSAWLRNAPGDRGFHVNAVPGTTPHEYAAGLVFPMGQIEPGKSASADDTLYVGPQEENKLAALAPGLELVKDYGWLTILSKPLFWLLDHLHKLIGNWGWAIVSLVVLLKIAFYWLNASAYRSMAKMKAVNPKVMEMRARLKDKPQEMQQEMMRIYREEKVNPLGGCLPIFAQMPFFIALYWVLLSTVEMRHAPWLGWIVDLSARDPYFILPVLMTATSLFQVWLNPTPPDPMQAKMAWMMPLIFSVMFFFFPAGLVLYWLTNNILSITQQWIINKQLGVHK